MDVLLAGGSGFVGRSLRRALVDRGHAVTVASRTPDSVGFALPALLASRLLEGDDTDGRAP